jgi:hypothetical protein
VVISVPGRIVDVDGVVSIVGVPELLDDPTAPTGPVLPIIPGDFTLGVYRGDTYEWVFQLLAGDGAPVDITGWRFKADIRTGPGGELMAGLQRMRAVDPTLDLSSAEDILKLQGEWQQGLVRMRLTADQSRAITSPGVWDLECTTPDGWVKTVLRGPVELTNDVTTGKVTY